MIKKRITDPLLLLLMAVFFSLSSEASYKDGYYNLMDGKQREYLKAAAKECVKSHQRLNYTDLPTYWQYSDVYPDKYNGNVRWWEMYSDAVYLIQNGQTARQSFSANKMQREHSIPKSWWKYNGDVEYTPAYSDMWNLFPSDGAANQAKLNYPLGPTRTTSYNNGVSKVGPPQTGYGGGCGNVFEPADEYKGDFARSTFYMALVYDDLPWCVNYMFSADSQWPTLKPWAYEMLLQWARQDPVSQKEIVRNDEVEKCQGNRNPFVDFPELAEYIWGSRTTQTFYLSEQGGPVTPPITGDPELTLPVSGETLDFGQCALGSVVNMSLVIEGSNLTAPLSVRLSGSDKGEFIPETMSIPAAQINTNGRYLLSIAYRPTHLGKGEAKLMLYDGGLPDGYNVAVTLRGEGMDVPSLSRLTALEATDITPTGYTAHWTKAPEIVDYYQISRVRYYEGDTQVETYTTGELSYTFTDRDPSVMESYTVVSSRLGFQSETSNSIIVDSASGVDEVYSGSPFNIGVLEDGFVMLIDGENTNLRIYDVSGRIVESRAVVHGGDRITLPQGLYIIVSDQAVKPFRIVVR